MEMKMGRVTQGRAPTNIIITMEAMDMDMNTTTITADSSSITTTATIGRMNTVDLTTFIRIMTKAREAGDEKYITVIVKRLMM